MDHRFFNKVWKLQVSVFHHANFNIIAWSAKTISLSGATGCFDFCAQIAKNQNFYVVRLLLSNRYPLAVLACYTDGVSSSARLSLLGAKPASHQKINPGGPHSLGLEPSGDVSTVAESVLGILI